MFPDDVKGGNVSETANNLIVDTLHQTTNPVIGIATGSTPLGMYKSLVERYKSGEVSFRELSTFNLDEYVGLGKEDPNSYFH